MAILSLCQSNSIDHLFLVRVGAANMRKIRTIFISYDPVFSFTKTFYDFLVYCTTNIAELEIYSLEHLILL